MKKSTKKTLMALFIVIIFGMSSIAFVVSSFGTEEQQQLQLLDTFVVDGDIDPLVEDAYIRAGFTFLKVYQNEETPGEVILFANQAPQTFTTNNGQTQLVVQKLTSETSYVKISNINGETDIFNVTVSNIFDVLCNNLVALPAECALHGLDI